MKQVALGVCLLTFFSCNNMSNRNKGKKYFVDLLKDVDKVQLVFFNHGDTLREAVTDAGEIDMYKEIINGKRISPRALKCDSTGQLLFIEKDEVVLRAWFSTPASGSKFDKNCVTYSSEPNVYGTPFTYRSARDIDDYYYKLRSTAIRMAQHD